MAKLTLKTEVKGETVTKEFDAAHAERVLNLKNSRWTKAANAKPTANTAAKSNG